MPDGVAAKGVAKVKVEKAKTEQKPDNIFKKISRFVRESYIEVVKKAAWPTWPELKKFTAVVILAVIIVGIWIGGLDAFLTAVTKPLGLGPK